MGCTGEDFTLFALGRASTAYRALIIVGLVVPADVNPECILRVVFCNFRLGLVTIQPQRPFHAASNGGPCKRTLEMRRVILQLSAR